MKKFLIVLAVVAVIAIITAIVYNIGANKLRKTVLGKMQASAKKHGKVLDEPEATMKLKTLDYFQLKTLSQWMDLILENRPAGDRADKKLLEKMKKQSSVWPSPKYEMIVFGS